MYPGCPGLEGTPCHWTPGCRVTEFLISVMKLLVSIAPCDQVQVATVPMPGTAEQSTFGEQEFQETPHSSVSCFQPGVKTKGGQLPIIWHLQVEPLQQPGHDEEELLAGQDLTYTGARSCSEGQVA